MPSQPFLNKVSSNDRRLGPEAAAKVVDPVVEHDGGGAVLERGGTGDEVASHADTEEHELVIVNKWLGESVVEDWGDDIFPVVPEKQSLLSTGLTLTWAVKG